ncbi:MAG TPA: NlpC/P60 family protein [Acidimicrobiales bacterium]|nr:NlpC/P60 family protein [Acidimicrobiales bacterium]
MPRTRLVGAALVVAMTAGVALPATASPVDDKQREAQQIANRIEQLGDEAASLGEAYNGAQIALQAATAAVTEAEQRLNGLEAQLGTLRSAMSQFAVRAYMYSDQISGLVATLTGSSVDSGAAQRAGYTAVALGNSETSKDELKALLQDTARQRQQLADRQAAKQRAVELVAARQKAAQTAKARQEQQLVKVKGQLATLVAQEQQRRRDEAAALAWAQQAQLAGTLAAAQSRPANLSASNFSVPSTSPGAAIAVRAALSQLGLPYVFNAASPGRAFDCSGLTMWAWAQAGVSMAHYTVSQWNAFPKVSLQALQPGDLILSYHLGHVGLYIGNGMMVAAPRTGDVVKITPVFGIRPLDGAVRPG